MDVQTIAAIVFLLILLVFWYVKRKDIVIQKLFGPFLYFGMYKTKHGLRAMDSLAKRWPKFLKYLGYFGVGLAFVGMILIAYSLLSNFLKLVFIEETISQVALVLPVKVKGSFYVPFLYWIISIFVIATIHEFSHGVISRLYKIKVKSSGFAFLGILIPIIPAAFVEPDEKELKKRPKLQQMSVFAAGPVSNILLGILCLALLLFVANPVASSVLDMDGVGITGYTKQGNTTYPAERAGIAIGEVIIDIDGEKIKTIQNFTDFLATKQVGDTVKVVTKNTSYEVTLSPHPEKENSTYMGVFVNQKTEFKENLLLGKPFAAFMMWVVGLLYWLYLLNIGIGLFNLVPLGPIDGGRMLQQALLGFMNKKKADRIWKSVGYFFLGLIIVNITYGFIQ